MLDFPVFFSAMYYNSQTMKLRLKVKPKKRARSSIKIEARHAIPVRARVNARPTVPVTKMALLQPLPHKERRKISITILLGLILISILQLLTNIALSSNVYEISRLQKEARELNLTKEIMEQEMYDVSSLVTIDSKARALGMQQSDNIMFLRLSDGVVLGGKKR